MTQPSPSPSVSVNLHQRQGASYDPPLGANPITITGTPSSSSPPTYEAPSEPPQYDPAVPGFVASTVTYTFHGFSDAESTVTITLEPQTTPFTPVETMMTNGCKKTILCGVDADRRVSDGGYCFYWDHVTADQALPFRKDCHPPGYAELFNGVLGGWEDLNFAYPGTACPSDWTVGCTTAFQVSTVVHRQTWCCPPSGFACAPSSRREQSDGRDCISMPKRATDVWISEAEAEVDAPLVKTRIGPFTRSNQGGVTIYHNVFPLVGVANAAPQETTRGADDTDSALNGEKANSNNADLSTGAIAGIVVGVVAFMVFLVAAALLVFCHRRRSSPQCNEPNRAHEMLQQTRHPYDPHVHHQQQQQQQQQQTPPQQHYSHLMEMSSQDFSQASYVAMSQDGINRASSSDLTKHASFQPKAPPELSRLIDTPELAASPRDLWTKDDLKNINLLDSTPMIAELPSQRMEHC